MSFQPQIRQLPIQTRRRNSRESLVQQQQPHGGNMQNAVGRTHPLPPLSITIPSSKDSSNKEQNTPAELKDHGAAMDTNFVAGQEKPGTCDDDTPREKVVTFSPRNDGNEVQENDEDAQSDHSDQSSICQSPSWEGYGQKKKDKKKKQEAEQRKKAMEKTEQELRAAAKKKSANRLFKTPPADMRSHSTDTKERPSSSMSSRLNSSGKLSMKSQASAQPARPNSRLALSEGKEDSIQAPTNGKVPYPPPSSRTHTLRAAVASLNHSRHNSVSDVTSIASRTDEPSKISNTQNTKSQGSSRFYSTTTGSVSDQSLSTLAEPLDRGRQNEEPGAAESYVRKWRAQSMERSIKGFMQEAELYDSNPTSSFNKLTTSSGQNREQPQSTISPRPTSSQSKQLQTTKPVKGNDVPVVEKKAPNVANVRRSSQPEKRPQTEKKQHETEMPKVGKVEQHVAQPQQQAQKTKLSQPASSAVDAIDNDGDSSTDYFTFVTKPYSPPTLDLTAPHGGILSSIKSRISRRSSVSSSSTAPSGNRSFKERALGVMHLPTAPTMHPTSHPTTQRSSVNSSETTTSAYSGSRTGSAAHSLQAASQRDSRRMPKPARVLGEYNVETMSHGVTTRSRPSEGSSTSSYHDDSSIPPSPASTPDTSRPQSAKGLSATIEEIRIGSPKMFMSSQDDLTLIHLKQSPQDTAQESKDSAASELTTDNGRHDSENKPSPQKGYTQSAQRPTSKTAMTRERSVDRPSSKGRLLGNVERPSSRGRILENVERPKSRGRVLEEVKQPLENHKDSTKESMTKELNKDTIIADSAPNLSEGLGILNEAWCQSTATTDIDAQSFVTTLTNQNSKTSLISQPTIPVKGVIAEIVNPAQPKLDKNLGPGSNVQEEFSQQVRNQSDENEQKHQVPLSDGVKPNTTSRKKEKRTSSHAKHMSIVNEEPKSGEEALQGQQSRSMAVNPTQASGNVGSLPPIVQEVPIPARSKARNATTEKPKDPNTSTSANEETNNATVTPAPAPEAEATAAVPSSSGRNSPSAMYLQEARRSAPMVSSPLSNVIRSAKASMSTPSLLASSRSGLKSPTTFLNSSQPINKVFLPLPPAPPPTPGTAPSTSPTSPRFRIPAHEPEQVSKLAKPMTKMLVECCRCKFFHDMPSRVYECMAQPDAVVTDRDLGVSGAITTMVKCPWCSHNMSTQCCAGYAAVVYLERRLH
ncbi:hypothetical protein SPI_03872 [Niveomyces insectorum RCEF 264]|uniref:Uncharacterized protein n=1 Tax=Niveomyces insectorum RCEF 264 TaxID=1081102 RepID=A0A167WF63_9HYPO|nr:hypothetical protein SPI_03872 [Niveomyces insectorum RCEF 264]